MCFLFENQGLPLDGSLGIQGYPSVDISVKMWISPHFSDHRICHYVMYKPLCHGIISPPDRVCIQWGINWPVLFNKINSNTHLHSQNLQNAVCLNIYLIMGRKAYTRANYRLSIFILKMNVILCQMFN